VRLGLRFVRAEDGAAEPPEPFAPQVPPEPPEPAAPPAPPVPPEAPESPAPPGPPAPPVPRAPGAPVSSLSYSSLGAYARCGYRFYLERVLRLPEAPAGSATVLEPAAPDEPSGLAATDRGTIIHALLERLDFRRPLTPTADAAAAAATAEGIPAPAPEDVAEIADTIERFAASALSRRLAAATGAVHREERFAFLLGDVLIVGAIDALAWEPGDHALVVDYKSDCLEGRAPSDVVAAEYETQRLIYALAALRAGARSVDVAHVFLERPEDPAVAAFTGDDASALESRLQVLSAGVLASVFTPAAEPQRALCSRCPGEGGPCSWPLAMTRREDPERLF
jgi:RecB family exonuclease